MQYEITSPEGVTVIDVRVMPNRRIGPSDVCGSYQVGELTIDGEKFSGTTMRVDGERTGTFLQRAWAIAKRQNGSVKITSYA